ncbi:MAG: cobaltochelatase subunit CobN, partial [Rhodospirillales bacterium]|nr:cobaltochelatase subunit CobN [Rhodospirillales bacterium]
MHLLAAQPGGIADGSEAIDLGQSPGDIVVLSAADTELASLAAARAEYGVDFPAVRCANLLNLAHNLSVDTYVEAVIARAKLVVVRLLGGVGYWPYGIEQTVDACRSNGVKLALLPGDDQPDAELTGLSGLAPESLHRLWQYCVHGGPENARNFLAYAAELIGHEGEWREPVPVLRCGLYWPGMERLTLDDLRAEWSDAAPIAAIVFYRALLQASNLAPVDALIRQLRAEGMNPLPVYTQSLKDAVSAGIMTGLLQDARPDVILNATGFAVSSPGHGRRESPFDGAACPVLQVVFAGGTEEAWAEGTSGLSARDIAMNVALPEVDGRVLAGAVSFKTEARFDAATEASVVTYKDVPDRIAFTAQLAVNWARLARTPARDRRVALILANYPNRDGRIGNGVGLDTPASTLNLLRAMAEAGYAVGELPADGNALVRRLAMGPTNDLAARAQRMGGERLARDDYEAFFATLPGEARRRVVQQWGRAEDDPFFADGQFRLSVVRFGNVALGLQPARGYNIDPVSTYHDPDLVPPHGYLAFYAWLRGDFGAQAMIHMGKHGNMEWLPGKSLALSAACFPEIAQGPTPHIYPFIVNDPGEGSQAKRRARAVIVDHLTPPLTRAETYGPLAELEQLVDEYYEAAGVDPRRLAVLRDDILELTRTTGLDKDSAVAADDEPDAALAKLDNYLCELKEMQIRDGLHVFGLAPQGRLLTDLLVALTRLPRFRGENGDVSLIRALAADFGLSGGGDGFDPLDCEMGAPWTGPRPKGLANGQTWRSNGDTVELLEILAARLVGGQAAPDPAWRQTGAVLEFIASDIRPAVAASGTAEIGGALTALDGRFVEPGPSGAPTRGRTDVLPTGRNFYSLDSRTVPTPAAWTAVSARCFAATTPAEGELRAAARVWPTSPR